MKKYISLSLVILILAFASCKSNGSNDENNGQNPTLETTTIEFDQHEFAFGSIEQGEQVSKTFVFKNTGDNPLVISDVKTSCGCTVPSYSKEPVGPGSEGFLKVTFNSAGKSGSQHKTVTVISNTDPEYTDLILTGTVNVSE